MQTLASKLVLSLIDRVTGPARNIAANLSRMQAAQKRNMAQMNAMRGRMLDAAAAGYVLAKAISSPINSAIEFESAMADVKKVVDFDSPASFKQMSKDIIDLSTKLPMTANGIAEIVAAAGQSGMKGDELMQFATLAAKVGVAFDMSAGQTGESLAKIKTALKLSVAETSALADAMNHLSNTSASSAPDLIDYMKRVGAVGEQYGFTAEQTAAIGSAMIASGAEANVAATSFRNVGKALTRGTSSSKRQIDAYKLLGLSASKTAKQMQNDATGTLRAVMQQISKLPEHLKASTISDLFGDEARAIAPLINNLELMDKALASVAQQQNYLGSSQKEYEARAATTANATVLFGNKAKAASIAIGEALLPALNSVMDFLAPFLLKITEIARANPELTATIVAVAAGLVALRIAAIAARFSFLWMKGGFISAAIVGLKGVGGAAGVVTKSLKAMRLAMVGASMLGTVGGGSAFASSLTAVMAPIATMKAAALGLAGAIASITWPIWLLVAAVAAFAVAIRHYWEPISNFVSGFASEMGAAIYDLVTMVGGIQSKITSAVGSWATDRIVDIAEMIGIDGPTVRSAIDGAMSTLGEFGSRIRQFVSGIAGDISDWFSDIFSVKDYSSAAEAEFRSAGENAARAIIDAVKSIPGQIVALFSGLGAKIAAAIGSINWSALVPSWARKFLGGASAPPVSGGIAGARAAGGNVAGGKTYLVGEEGPELHTGSRNGYIHNAGDTARMLSGGGSSSAPSSVSLGGLTLNLYGVQDPESLADSVVPVLEQMLREAMAGIQADTEWT